MFFQYFLCNWLCSPGCPWLWGRIWFWEPSKALGLRGNSWGGKEPELAWLSSLCKNRGVAGWFCLCTVKVSVWFSLCTVGSSLIFSVQGVPSLIFSLYSGFQFDFLPVQWVSSLIFPLYSGFQFDFVSQGLCWCLFRCCCCFCWKAVSVPPEQGAPAWEPCASKHWEFGG